MKRQLTKPSTVSTVVGTLPKVGWRVVVDGKAVTLRSSAKSKALIAKSTKRRSDVLKRLARA
jgi:hypothetical protein